MVGQQPNDYVYALREYHFPQGKNTTVENKNTQQRLENMEYGKQKILQGLENMLLISSAPIA